MEQIIALLEAQNQLLSSLCSSLPDSGYYQRIGDSADLLRSYLEESTSKEQEQKELHAEEREADEEQLSQIRELLTSLDEKVVKDETQVLSDETYLETNTQIIDALKLLNEQAETTSVHVQNLENIQIPMLCGVGMIFGVICTVILSRFIHH